MSPIYFSIVGIVSLRANPHIYVYIRSSMFIDDATQIRETLHFSLSFSIKCDWIGVLRVVFEDLAFSFVYVEAY